MEAFPIFSLHMTQIISVEFLDPNCNYPLLFSKLEAYSVLQYMYLWMHVAWNT